MLSEFQTPLHWRLWGEVCRKNNWHDVRGQVAESALRKESEYHQSVWAFAEMLARQGNRPVVADHLRKGAYCDMLARPKSLTQFDNADLDRVLVLFRLLIEPADLTAGKDYAAYKEYDRVKAEIARCRHLKVPCALTLPDDPGQRRRLLNAVKQAPLALVNYFLRQETEYFLTMDYESLPLAKLHSLVRTLKNRRAEFRRPVAAAVMADNEPF
jgi:hypothetical protein